MATRRRTTDLEALKSKLGALPEPAASAAQPSEAPAPEAAASSEPEAPAEPSAAASAAAPPGLAASAPAAAPASSAPAAPAASDGSAEDYSEAVREEEEVDLSKVDTEPIDTSAIKRSSAGILILALFVGTVSLGIGYGSATVKEGRELSRMRQDQAGTVAGSVSTVLRTLTRLQNDLEDVGTQRYAPEFQAHLREAFTDTPPVLDSSTLTMAGALLLYDPVLSSDLFRLATDSRILEQLARRHMQLTERDAREIQAEIAGSEDDRNFGIVFDLQGQARAYQGVLGEEGDVAAYAPIRGMRVTYDSLEVISEESGSNTDFFYNVTFADGQERRVPIYDLLVLPKEQLVESASTETALSRYLARSAELVTYLSELNSRNGRLVSEIERIADGTE